MPRDRLVRDIASTTVTLMGISVAMMVTTRLVAEGLGPTEFGVYSVAKRLVGMLVPLTSLTMGMALARHVAMAAEDEHRQEFLVVATTLVALVSLPLVAIAVVYREPLGWLLFGRPDHSGAVAGAAILVLGLGIYAILYGLYRGIGRVKQANAIQLAFDGVAPMLIAGYFVTRGGLSVVLSLTGAFYCVAAIPVAAHLFRGIRRRRRRLRIGHALHELLQYGFPRVPGAVTFAGILAAGPMVAAAAGAVESAGYLVAGQVVFAVADAAFAAFGLVLLPRVARFLADGETGTICRLVDDLMALGLYVGTFAAVQLLVWGDYLVLVWLGDQYRPAIPLVRILAVALIPHVLYGILRSVIDAVDRRAMNARHLYIAFGSTVVACATLSGLGTDGLAAATVLGFIVLGLATLRYLWTRGWLTGRDLDVPRLVTLNVIGAVLAVTVRYAVEPLGPTAALAVGGLIELLMFGLYCAILRWLNVRWIVAFGARDVTPA
jgi:O-antigen/teichoic acid export membrane protein